MGRGGKNMGAPPPSMALCGYGLQGEMEEGRGCVGDQAGYELADPAGRMTSCRWECTPHLIIASPHATKRSHTPQTLPVCSHNSLSGRAPTVAVVGHLVDGYDLLGGPHQQGGPSVSNGLAARPAALQITHAAHQQLRWLYTCVPSHPPSGL